MAGMREPLGEYTTIGQIKLGPFISDADGKTPLTNLTIEKDDVQLSKNNRAFAPKYDTSNSLHDENGWYDVVLVDEDLDNPGYLDVLIDLPGALPVRRKYIVYDGGGG